uniref:Uncharacterized protein n=1 Tax=Rhizophora mucronata TaxID=61149 RepID=A0A2P2QJ09_RHIMU
MYIVIIRTFICSNAALGHVFASNCLKVES